MLCVSAPGLARLRESVRGIKTDQALAERIGIDRTTVSRVLSGKAEPGARFIEGILRAFGYKWFREIIEISD